MILVLKARWLSFQLALGADNEDDEIEFEVVDNTGCDCPPADSDEDGAADTADGFGFRGRG